MTAAAGARIHRTFIFSRAGLVDLNTSLIDAIELRPDMTI